MLNDYRPTMTEAGAAEIKRVKMRNPKLEPSIKLYSTELDCSLKHQEYYITKRTPRIFYVLEKGPDIKQNDQFGAFKDEWKKRIVELNYFVLDKYDFICDQVRWMWEHDCLPAGLERELKSLGYWSLVEHPNGCAGGGFILDEGGDVIRVNFRLDVKLLMIGNKTLHQHIEGDRKVFYLLDSDDQNRPYQCVNRKEVIRLIKKNFEHNKELTNSMLKVLEAAE